MAKFRAAQGRRRAPRSTRGRAASPGHGPTRPPGVVRRGTQPGRPAQVDQDGLLYTQSCGGWRVDPVGAELGPPPGTATSRTGCAAPAAGRGSAAGSIGDRLLLGQMLGGAGGSSGRARHSASSPNAIATRTSRRTEATVAGTVVATEMVVVAPPSRHRLRPSLQAMWLTEPPARGPAGPSCRVDAEGLDRLRGRDAGMAPHRASETIVAAAMCGGSISNRARRFSRVSLRPKPSVPRAM